MNAKLKRFAIYVSGWSFIILGILGLVLPILQGILFLLIGLFLLSSVSPWADRLLKRIKNRFPKLSNKLDEARSKAKEAQTKLAARFDTAKSKTKDVHSQVFKRKQREPRT